MDKCSECWARYLCGGTCHYNSIVNNKTIFETDDFECQIRKCVIEEAINFLIKLIENKIDFRKVISALNK
ncbi:MAG: SPASM domain-containing protein [Clostridia bacterium]|nr:SPASM domain-containing protein [Clostridia bacterium]